MSAAIEFRDVSFALPQGRKLLERISLAMDEGTTTVVLGRSGSGKTTLLRTVNRMVEPTSGTVLVNGEDVRQTDLIRLRRGIGYVIQETGLFPHMTAERDVGLVLEAEGRRERASGCGEAMSCWRRLGSIPDSLRDAIRMSFPEGSGSAWVWRGRWRPIRRCC